MGRVLGAASANWQATDEEIFFADKGETVTNSTCISTPLRYLPPRCLHASFLTRHWHTPSHLRRTSRWLWLSSIARKDHLPIAPRSTNVLASGGNLWCPPTLARPHDTSPVVGSPYTIRFAILCLLPWQMQTIPQTRSPPRRTREWTTSC